MAADLVDAVLRAVERGGGGHLHRREGAVVEIGLHARQRADQPLVADGEAHAPAGHGVRLRQRGELHRDVDGARHLQHRGRRIAVEVDLRVGEVGQDDQVELLGELHDLRIEVEADRHGRRIGGIAQHDGQRLGDRVLHRPLDAAQECASASAPVKRVTRPHRRCHYGNVTDGGARR